MTAGAVTDAPGQMRALLRFRQMDWRPARHKGVPNLPHHALG